MSDILAYGPWRNNAELIVACRDLGYLPTDGIICDPTYGYGRFWTLWRPELFWASDLNPAKSPDIGSLDARHLPCCDNAYAATVIDAPYKLNGRPTKGEDSMDESYGVDEAATVAERYTLMAEMLAEAGRITRPKGYVLFKCQAQVVSGKVHWQPRFFANLGEALGMRLKDELHLITRPRPQPGDRAQKHARRNGSVMLVFQVGKITRALDDTTVDYYGQKPW